MPKAIGPSLQSMRLTVARYTARSGSSPFAIVARRCCTPYGLAYDDRHKESHASPTGPRQ